MTLVEYRRAYTQCEIRYLNDKSDTNAVAEQNKLLRDCKKLTLFTLHKDFTQLEHETMYLLNNSTTRAKLKQVYNYYEEREKHQAIIPKSLYNNSYIPKTTTKRTPKEIKERLPEVSLRGYEMPLIDLANILNLKLD